MSWEGKGKARVRVGQEAPTRALPSEAAVRANQPIHIHAYLPLGGLKMESLL